MMRKWVFVLATVACLTTLFLALRSSAQPQIPVTTKEFMREKLAHSQQLLEALATEDFFTLDKNARKLSGMTQDASWQAFQNPDYAQFSVAFRRHTDALARAAKDKDLDAATLAYVRVTMSCVDCHKAVRGKVVGWGSGWPTRIHPVSSSLDEIVRLEGKSSGMIYFSSKTRRL